MPVEYLAFLFLNNTFSTEINLSLSDCLYLFCVTYCPSLTTSDRWIPSNYPITENIRAIYLTLEKLIQSEETQVNGIVILADYKGVSLSKASHFGPFIAKKVIGILQVWPLFVTCLFLWVFGFSRALSVSPLSYSYSQKNAKALERNVKFHYHSLPSVSGSFRSPFSLSKISFRESPKTREMLCAFFFFFF